MRALRSPKVRLKRATRDERVTPALCRRRSIKVRRFSRLTHSPLPPAAKHAIRGFLGIGADSGHHEHRSPRTRVATNARGMTVHLPQINCPVRAAAPAEQVEPLRPCDQRGADCQRPQHVPAGGELLVPTFDDGLRLGARRSRQRASAHHFGAGSPRRQHACPILSPHRSPTCGSATLPRIRLAANPIK
jgi:hypothetical protein